MAKTLLDSIKNQLSGPADTPGMTDETERTRGLLRAKLGKGGVEPSGPSQTSMAEQAQVQKGRLAGEELQREGRLKAEALGEQGKGLEQSISQKQQLLEEKKKDIKSRFQMESDNLLQEFERGRLNLEDRRDAAKAEQLGFIIRLENQKYVNNLQNIGRKQRLDDQASFKEQAARDLFSDQESLMRDDIAFKTILSASDRDFQRELSDIDINYAMQIADDAQRAEATRAVFTGIGSGVSAGTTAWKEGAFKSKETPPTEGKP